MSTHLYKVMYIQIRNLSIIRYLSGGCVWHDSVFLLKRGPDITKISFLVAATLLQISLNFFYKEKESRPKLWKGLKVSCWFYLALPEDKVERDTDCAQQGRSQEGWRRRGRRHQAVRHQLLLRPLGYHGGLERRVRGYVGRTDWSPCKRSRPASCANRRHTPRWLSPQPPLPPPRRLRTASSRL